MKEIGRSVRDRRGNPRPPASLFVGTKRIAADVGVYMSDYLCLCKRGAKKASIAVEI